MEIGVPAPLPPGQPPLLVELPPDELPPLDEPPLEEPPPLDEPPLPREELPDLGAERFDGVQGFEAVVGGAEVERFQGG